MNVFYMYTNNEIAFELLLVGINKFLFLPIRICIRINNTKLYNDFLLRVLNGVRVT